MINKKYYLIIALGIFLSIIGNAFNIKSIELYTLGGLSAGILVPLISHLLIIAVISFVISLMLRKDKKLFIPIFVWLFIFVSIVNITTAGYIKFVASPQLEETLYSLTINKKLNNPKLQFIMAQKYLRGDGVMQSHKKALEYLIKSAQNGYDKAQLNVGVMLLTGIGLPASETKGLYWLNLSAKQGNKEAREHIIQYHKFHNREFIK